jgi:enoyl-CoA hydratase/carnithine racemase
MQVRCEVRDQTILWVTLDADGGVAAMDPGSMSALADAWRRLRDDPDIRVAVLTASGDVTFCVGSNLKTFIPLLQSGELDPRDNQEAYMKGITGAVYKPVVAAVNGDCLGGGLEILTCTDIRLTVDHARFGLPECRWGVFPGGGGTVRLMRQLAYVHAMELMLTGAMISAARAREIGLVNSVVAPGMLHEEAHAMATMIAANGPLAVRRIKESAIRSIDLPLDAAYDFESMTGIEVFHSADAGEGLAAFKEKRTPEFRDGAQPRA